MFVIMDGAECSICKNISADYDFYLDLTICHNCSEMGIVTK